MDLAPYLAAAPIVTKVVDFARNAFDTEGKAPSWVWNLVAFGVGVGVAYVSELNLLPKAQFGVIVTGFALGAAASGFHEAFDLLSGKAKEAESNAGIEVK